MKRVLSLLVIGVLVLSIGVGVFVDAIVPKTRAVYDRIGSMQQRRPVYSYETYTSSGGAGPGAGMAVAGLAMTAGGIVMLMKRRKSTVAS